MRFPYFFCVWWNVFFRAILGKEGDLAWCFGGVSVVNCVANVVLVHHIFERPKNVPKFSEVFLRFDALRGRA
jgi:hypothetical protein